MFRQILPTLILAVLGVVLFTGLGIWQMQRLAWKQGVLADIDKRMVETLAELPATPDPDLHRYAGVELTGQAEGPELHVLVSHRELGPGFRIVTAFATDDGRRVLLDEGFVTDSKVDAPRPPLTGAITGNIHWPDDRTRSTPENDVAANFWFARDIDQMADVLQTEPILVILRNAPGLDPMLTPLPLDSSGVRNDHLQYAVTWFLLAATWAVMSVFLIRQSLRRTS